MGCILEVSLFWNSTTWVGIPKEAYYLTLPMLPSTVLGVESVRLLGTDGQHGGNKRTIWRNSHRKDWDSLVWPCRSQNCAREVIKGLAREWMTSLLNITYPYTKTSISFHQQDFPRWWFCLKKRYKYASAKGYIVEWKVNSRTTSFPATHFSLLNVSFSISLQKCGRHMKPYPYSVLP